MGINDYFITSKPNIDNNKELDSSNINAAKKTYTPQTIDDAQYSLINDLY